MESTDSYVLFLDLGLGGLKWLGICIFKEVCKDYDRIYYMRIIVLIEYLIDIWRIELICMYFE